MQLQQNRNRGCVLNVAEVNMSQSSSRSHSSSIAEIAASAESAVVALIAVSAEFKTVAEFPRQNS